MSMPQTGDQGTANTTTGISVVTAPYSVQLTFAVPGTDLTNATTHYVRYGVLHCVMTDDTLKCYEPINGITDFDLKHPDAEEPLEVSLFSAQGFINTYGCSQVSHEISSHGQRNTTQSTL
jgi:hypothetical protein